MDLLTTRVLTRHLRASTTPLPATFPKTEIGLMTQEEFLKFRDPKEETHPSDAYDFDLFKMNRDPAHVVGSVGSHGSEMLTVEKLSGGLRVVNQGDVIAVIHNGVAYYDKPHWKRQIPKYVYESRKQDQIPIDFTSYKQVKYLSEVIPLISPLAKLNDAKFPVVLQHIIVKGEPMSVRAEKAPAKDKQETIAIFNADGLIVAQAQDEWGATLLTVAHEYRGKGLGKIIGEFWYEYNPSSKSGGFTESGKRNALSLWRDRVHEFSSRGWYSALVREGRLSLKRVKEILEGSGQKLERPEAPQGVKATGEILVHSDGEITFVVYDRAFLEEPDEKFIHGYGFFRDAPNVGVYIYAIDYDRPFAGMTTRVALQMAKDNGEKLYVGEGYHDMLETDGIPGVVQEGNYLEVTQNLIPLKALAQKEKRLRKAVDPYEEKYNLLLEMAEAKWK